MSFGSMEQSTANLRSHSKNYCRTVSVTETLSKHAKHLLLHILRHNIAFIVWKLCTPAWLTHWFWSVESHSRTIGLWRGTPFASGAVWNSPAMILSWTESISNLPHSDNDKQCIVAKSKNSTNGRNLNFKQMKTLEILCTSDSIWRGRSGVNIKDQSRFIRNVGKTVD